MSEQLTLGRVNDKKKINKLVDNYVETIRKAYDLNEVLLKGLEPEIDILRNPETSHDDFRKTLSYIRELSERNFNTRKELDENNVRLQKLSGINNLCKERNNSLIDYVDTLSTYGAMLEKFLTNPTIH